MANSQLKNEILDHLNNVSDAIVSYLNFPSEPQYRVDDAIEQLYFLGFVFAKKSVAESHWTAYSITSKGQVYLESEGKI